MKRKIRDIAELAGQVLEHHLGRRPKRLKELKGGLVNHVFEAEVGGDELVLRISNAPEKLQFFMKEQWAVNAARRSKIPTPKILEVSNEVIGMPYMISCKVQGEAGGPVGHSRTDVVNQLGHYAAQINSIPTHDFGHIFDWSPNELSRNRTWREYLHKEMAVEKRIETLREGAVLDPANVKKLIKLARSMRQWTCKPTLNHGDLRLKNVILDGKRKIVAIVDWEECTSNVAPYWELSIALHDLTMDEKQSFLEGYGLDLKEFMRMAPAIKALNVLHYARNVRNALERKDNARLLSLRARLNGAFDLYSL